MSELSTEVLDTYSRLVGQPVSVDLAKQVGDEVSKLLMTNTTAAGQLIGLFFMTVANPEFTREIQKIMIVRKARDASDQK